MRSVKADTMWDGFHACMMGKSTIDNPHALQSLRNFWLQGFRDGQAVQRKRELQR